nr:MAG TPA: hypothetical protein [Caudoviricetes sp.]
MSRKLYKNRDKTKKINADSIHTWGGRTAYPWAFALKNHC